MPASWPVVEQSMGGLPGHPLPQSPARSRIAYLLSRHLRVPWDLPVSTSLNFTSQSRRGTVSVFACKKANNC